MAAKLMRGHAVKILMKQTKILNKIRINYELRFVLHRQYVALLVYSYLYK